MNVFESILEYRVIRMNNKKICYIKFSMKTHRKLQQIKHACSMQKLMYKFRLMVKYNIHVTGTCLLMLQELISQPYNREDRNHQIEKLRRRKNESSKMC